ncbi:type II toxin-antitoxin system Phd/YefM family antitoxin [Microseira sp. BLCC-F43]|jgi:PHD/YefM family antitoxin component YafN of YafNO toxin-antitoxin module|uniref:type II toxin-antitoxin system Phd/YefM family antitoxin n=1 Tax=Microseira sp. BLCC-F43 TaxID=3153602 RepID=UPI0035B84778
MKIISIEEIKANFESYLKQSPNEPIVITENGYPIAAINLIVDPEELERLLLAQNPKFNQILENSRRSLKEEGGLKSDEFWKLVDESSTQESER